MLPGLEHDVPLATARKLPRLYRCWQKTLDITFGILGAMIFLVLLPFLAVLILLDSPGPIFYSQERVGYRGQTFQMHKFRSMRPDAEQAGQAEWTTERDPRITRVGRFLRATRLDELPQMLNILLGEMSLIGPRPERPAYVAELEKLNPLYRRRLEVKPGLTGWAQVNYGYGTSFLDELEKLPYDLFYIEHQSCKLDFIILMKTISEVLSRHGQ